MYAKVILLFCAILASVANAKKSYNTTILVQQYGNVQKLNKTLSHVFKELDTNGDGYISFDEINLMLSNAKIAEKVNEAGQKDSLGDYLKPQSILPYLENADTNHDQKISKDEFYTEWVTALNVQITVNSPICKQAKEVMDPCSRNSFDLIKDVRFTMTDKDKDIILKQCNSGISSLTGYTVENCVINAASNIKNLKNDTQCVPLKQCVDTHFNRNAEQSKQLDNQYIQRNTEISEAIIWISVSVFVLASLGVGAMASLLQIGFLVVMVSFLAIHVFGLLVSWHWANQANLEAESLEDLVASHLKDDDNW